MMRRGLPVLMMGVCCLTAALSVMSSHAQSNRPRHSSIQAVAAGEETSSRNRRASDTQGHEFTQQPPQTIAPSLEQRLHQAAEAEMIAVIVFMRDQPAGPISRDVRARFDPQIEQRAAAARELTRAGLLKREANQAVDGQEIALAQPVELRRDLAQQIDELRRDSMREMHQRIAVAAAPSQDAVVQIIHQLGGEVTAQVMAVNLVAAIVPAGRIEQLASHAMVARVELDQPVFAELDLHRQSLGVESTFWANNITGGVFDCGVLDTGVQQSHPALSSHTFLSNMGANDTDPLGHGTGVAGILASTNATYRGIAFGLDTIVVAEASGTSSISMAGMDYIASTGEPENVNYSFGNIVSPNEDYTPVDQFFDAVIDTFGFMVTKSAGNNGYHATNSTITHPAHAYNLIATANMNDQNTLTREDDRIDGSSSVGPTQQGRKKPDLTAPGTNTMTCTVSGNFANFGGTSAAAPHVGAGVILLMDMGVTSPMAAKAILINSADAMTDNNTQSTADDAFVPGSLWNRRYGWGYLNLGRAYEHGLDYFMDSVSTAHEAPQFKLYKGPATEFDKFTLVWQRHVAYNGAAFPTQIESLSNLDLFAYRDTDNTQIAQSTSAIDNVEQLHIPGNESSIVVKVKALGEFDPDIAVEQFALATLGNMSAAVGPQFAAAFSHPPNVQPNAQFTLTATITNTGDLKAHAPLVQFAGMNVINGSNPAAIASLDPGAQANLAWTVQAPAFNGQYPVSLTVSTNSYGEQIAVAIPHIIVVNNCAADVTGDAQVSVPDLLAVVNAWGPCSPPPAACNADINHDGQVNVVDLIAVINSWGGCP